MGDAVRGGRRWLFRILALLLGLSPFIAVEVGLRLAGIGAPLASSDPFVEFTSVRPLFERNAATDRHEILASRQAFFRPDSFAVHKSPREFRIFCLGGSTVQGNPYSIETSFTTWLEHSLRAADPGRDWEVVNCGGISYASYRLRPILRECLAYQPDLFVLYVGDNEFLEERTYQPFLEIPPWLRWLSQVAVRSHLLQAVRGLGPTKDKSPKLPAEVDAVLDYQGGLAHYHRDDEWQRGVAIHFRHALSSMAQQAQQANVPVLLVDPVSNIKDCPPFKIITDPRFESRVIAPDSIEALEEACELDERNAGVQFLLGRAYLEAGRDEEARKALFRAKDEDVCPLRLTEPLREVIYSVASEYKIPIVPVLKEFSRQSPHGIPGDEMMLDHVHPTISGHQLIADLLLQTMQDSGWLSPVAGWQEVRQQRYRQHLATLDAPYYARGQEHLDGLRRWTQGRTKKLRTTK